MDLMIEDTQRMKMKASFHDDDSTHALFAPPNFKMAECPLPDGSNKIVCRSRHAVKVKAQNIYHSLFKALSENEARSGEDRKQYSDKFKEVYEKVLQQNIQVNGETSGDTASNVTPEYEPVDRQKELRINDDLLPQLDDCVVRIAKQRKQLPRACVNAVTDFSNHQASYMSTVKPAAQRVDVDTMINDTKDVTRFISCQNLTSPCSSLTQLSKTVLKDQERAKHVSQAVEIDAANKHCQTAAVMYKHTTLGEHNSHPFSGTCVSKRKLDTDLLEHLASTSKIARSSLAQDFVVQPLVL